MLLLTSVADSITISHRVAADVASRVRRALVQSAAQLRVRRAAGNNFRAAGPGGRENEGGGEGSRYTYELTSFTMLYGP